MHLRPMGRNYGEIRNRMKSQHSVQSTNRETDRMNQSILEQYPRAYINYHQANSCGYLPLADCAYKNGYQETIKNTPFFANYGINPEYKMSGHLIQGKQPKPEEITQLHESLRNEMVRAQLRQKAYYNLDRKPNPKLQSADMVWFVPATSKPQDHQKSWTTRKSDYSKSWQRLGQAHISWPDCPQLSYTNDLLYTSGD